MTQPIQGGTFERDQYGNLVQVKPGTGKSVGEGTRVALSGKTSVNLKGSLAKPGERGYGDPTPPGGSRYYPGVGYVGMAEYNDYILGRPLKDNPILLYENKKAQQQKQRSMETPEQQALVLQAAQKEVKASSKFEALRASRLAETKQKVTTPQLVVLLLQVED